MKHFETQFCIECCTFHSFVIFMSGIR